MHSTAVVRAPPYCRVGLVAFRFLIKVLQNSEWVSMQLHRHNAKLTNNVFYTMNKSCRMP